MKWHFRVLGLLLFVFVMSALPLQAQTAQAAAKPTARPWYDVNKEVTVVGTVSNVEKKSVPGVPLPGAHLVVETSTGNVNASLGRYAMKGKSTISVSAGQQVRMLGVMKTVKDQQVFVVRVLQVNGHAYTLRNQYGFAYASVARNGGAKSEGKWGQL